MSLHIKDPHGRIDHAIDWSAYLAGQEIIASSWSVTPDEDGGLAVIDHAFEPTRTSGRMSGGLAGRLYRVTNQVTLSDGQIDERSIHFRVEER
ncbi:hypothetical protein WG907_03835 [Sphingobium sp. AN558]|uniref:phage fiber-tail adaptor protein n=1 Tax=Sphingobium sp. AN558 TaxID=3133442 RepID=UPI0030BE6C09